MTLKLGFILTWKMHHWQTHLFTVQSIFSPISYHFDIMTNWPFPSAMQARSQQLGTIAKLNCFWKYCILSKAFKRRYLYLGIRIFRWRLSSAIRFIGELRRRMMKVPSIFLGNFWSPVFIVGLQHPLPSSFHRLFHYACLVGHSRCNSLQEVRRVLLIQQTCCIGPFLGCIWWRSWTTLFHALGQQINKSAFKLSSQFEGKVEFWGNVSTWQVRRRIKLRK